MNASQLGILRIPGCNTKNVSVFDKVGGEGMVSQAFNLGRRRLFLNYSSINPISHPLAASVRKLTSILLKVVKNSAGKVESVEILGFVTREFHFPNPFDCQLISFNSIQLPRVNQLLESAPLEFIDGKDKLIPDMKFQCHSKNIKFHDNIIPQPDSLAVIPRKQEKHTLVLNVLRLLFTARPIWSRKMLLGLPILEDHNQMTCSLLPYFAYFFSDGPWKGLWCRFGYDPRFPITITRSDDEKVDYYPSKYLQLFEFRLQKSSWDDIVEASSSLLERAQADKTIILDLDQMKWKPRNSFKADKLKKSESAVQSTSQFVKIFRSGLQRQVNHQFCDVLDNSFCHIAASASVSLPINRKCGWFSSADYELFKLKELDIVTDRLKAARDQSGDDSSIISNDFQTLSCFGRTEVEILDDFSRWSESLRNDDSCPEIFLRMSRDYESALSSVVNCMEAVAAVYSYRRFVDFAYPTWNNSSEHARLLNACSFADINTPTRNRSDAPIVSLPSVATVKKEARRKEKKKKANKKPSAAGEHATGKQKKQKPSKTPNAPKTAKQKKSKKNGDADDATIAEANDNTQAMIVDGEELQDLNVADITNDGISATEHEPVFQMMDEDQLDDGVGVEVFDHDDDDDNEEEEDDVGHRSDYYKYALQHGSGDMIVFGDDDDDDDV